MGLVSIKWCATALGATAETQLAGVLFRENDSPDGDVFRAMRLLRRPMHPARMRMCICTILVKVCEVPATQVAKFGVDSFRKYLIEICKAGVGVFPPIGKYES